MPFSPLINTPARFAAASSISAITGRIAGEWLYTVVAAAAQLTRVVVQLALDGPGDAPAAERAREHVGDAREHRFGRQIRPPLVNHREHERRGAVGADFLRELEGRAPRERSTSTGRSRRPSSSSA